MQKSSQGGTPRQSRLVPETDLTLNGGYSTDEDDDIADGPSSAAVVHRRRTSAAQSSLHSNPPPSISFKRGGGGDSTSSTTDSSDDECRIVPGDGNDDDDYLERLDRRVTEVISRCREGYAHSSAAVMPSPASYNRRSNRAKPVKTPSSSDGHSALTEGSNVNNNNNVQDSSGSAAVAAAAAFPIAAGLIRFEDEEGNAEADDTQESSQVH